ncbi:MAG: (2Fe-2S)-binding protein [Deltaproteobacteria bacterium]|nr:MAG: (2Fe-2S)-binding protein [Deltaproteobacteria bacterium]
MLHPVTFTRRGEEGFETTVRLEVEEGTSLRRALLRAAEVDGVSVSPHNGAAAWVNCRGFGTCGTCAVEVVRGEVPPAAVREAWRLDFPPHHAGSHGGRLRLACRIAVHGPLEVVKHPGFWGQEEQSREDAEQDRESPSTDQGARGLGRSSPLPHTGE